MSRVRGEQDMRSGVEARRSGGTPVALPRIGVPRRRSDSCRGGLAARSPGASAIRPRFARSRHAAHVPAASHEATAHGRFAPCSRLWRPCMS